jgi:hypothetical protein
VRRTPGSQRSVSTVVRALIAAGGPNVPDERSADVQRADVQRADVQRADVQRADVQRADVQLPCD